MYAINKNTGLLFWSKSVDGGVKSSPTIDQSGNVYFGGADEKLYKVSETNGNTIWACALGDTVGESSPAIDTTNNLVVIGANNGIIYAASTTTSTCNSFVRTYTT